MLTPCPYGPAILCPTILTPCPYDPITGLPHHRGHGARPHHQDRPQRTALEGDDAQAEHPRRHTQPSERGHAHGAAGGSTPRVVMATADHGTVATEVLPTRPCAVEHPPGRPGDQLRLPDGALVRGVRPVLIHHAAHASHTHHTSMVHAVRSTRGTRDTHSTRGTHGTLTANPPNQHRACVSANQQPYSYPAQLVLHYCTHTTSNPGQASRP